MKKRISLVIILFIMVGVGAILKSNATQSLKPETVPMKTEMKPETTKPETTKPAATKTMTAYTKPAIDVLQTRLTDIQFRVTQKDATERPFSNQYNDEKRAGIYVDIVSGEPLFSSKDKFDSGTGWPSFSRPLEPDNVAEKTDYNLLFPRTEIRSYHADSHLGHLFKDGPAPTGLRYCMNSAALRFIPKEQLAEAGYEQYAGLFEH